MNKSMIFLIMVAAIMGFFSQNAHAAHPKKLNQKAVDVRGRQRFWLDKTEQNLKASLKFIDKAEQKSWYLPYDSCKDAVADLSASILATIVPGNAYTKAISVAVAAVSQYVGSCRREWQEINNLLKCARNRAILGEICYSYVTDYNIPPHPDTYEKLKDEYLGMERRAKHCYQLDLDECPYLD